MPRRSLTGFLQRSPFLDVYRQEGESNAYATITTGQNLTVDAAKTKGLAWLYTPPVDVWAEVTIFVGTMNKTDANYHYAQMHAICNPAPVIGVADVITTKTQHSTVQIYDFYTITKLWGLAAGIQYSMYGQFTMSGGTWQYHQAQGWLWMHGKSWPR